MGRLVDENGIPLFNDDDRTPTHTLPTSGNDADHPSKENKMPIYLDPEIRAHLVEYFTKSINHSYSDAKYVRMLLKAQNLTINDILISAEPEEIVHTPTNAKFVTDYRDYRQEDENEWKDNPKSHPLPMDNTTPVTDYSDQKPAWQANANICDSSFTNTLLPPDKTTTIKPIPSNKDIDDLEYCYNNLEFLTASRQKFVLDNFKSRKDNIVSNSNNDTLSPARRRYVDICLGIIAKELNTKE